MKNLLIILLALSVFACEKEQPQPVKTGKLIFHCSWNNLYQGVDSKGVRVSVAHNLDSAMKSKYIVDTFLTVLPPCDVVLNTIGTNLYWTSQTTIKVSNNLPPSEIKRKAGVVTFDGKSDVTVNVDLN